MLYDFYSGRQRDERAGLTTRPIEAGDARMNPWLLWRPEGPPAPQVLTVAEMAECVCPDLCNRDHVNE